MKLYQILYLYFIKISEKAWSLPFFPSIATPKASARPETAKRKRNFIVSELSSSQVQLSVIARSNNELSG